jgi:coenzyme F420-reducing hydrogenase alpha subunit
VAGFDFPDLAGEWELVALRQPGEYPITRGRLVSTGGLDLAPEEFSDHLVEEHLQRSTALYGSLRGREPYLVGPLARYVLNADELTPLARTAATDAGLHTATRNPFHSIIVRAVETLHACDEALGIIDAYEQPDAPSVPIGPRAGIGAGWTEAPRGILWHRYEIAADGTILDAQIVPPTAQNQRAIELDVFGYVGKHLDVADHELAHGAEWTIRNHDPCISCATHFLDLHVERS